MWQNLVPYLFEGADSKQTFLLNMVPSEIVKRQQLAESIA